MLGKYFTHENIDKFERIINLVKPKFYNKLTWFVIVSGIAIISKPFWLEVLNIILEKNYQINITDEHDVLIGFLLVVIAFIYNLITVYFDKFLIHKVDSLMMSEQSKVDKELYLKFIEDFPSNGNVIFFLRDYDLHDSFDYNLYITPLNNIYNKWKIPECDFLDKEINIAKKNMLKNIDDFISDIAMNSFSYYGHQRIIPPELGDYDFPKDLIEKIKRMNDLATLIYEEHQEFIKLCKVKLYI